MDGTISQYEQKSFEELRLEYYNKASNISGAPSGEREESTEALSNQQMNSMKVLDLISRARDEVKADELLMHDANAIKTQDDDDFKNVSLDLPLPWWDCR